MLKRQPIRVQIVAVFGALILLVAAAFLWSARQTQTEREGELFNAANALAVAAAAHVDEHISGVEAIGTILSRHPAMGDAGECQRLFGDVVRDTNVIANALVVASDGEIRCAARQGSFGGAGTQWAGEVIRGAAPIARSIDALPGNGPSSPSTRAHMVLGYPIMAGPNVDAALGLVVEFGWFEALFRRLALPQESTLSLIGPDHRPIIDVSASGVARDVPRVSAEQAARRGPWRVRVGIPRSVALDRLQPFWRRNLGILTAAVAATLLVGFIGAWQTTAQLSRLEHAARRIAEGDLSPPAVEAAPNREFAHLQDAFVAMAAKLREARDSLDERIEQERRMTETVRALQQQVVRQERLAAVGLLVAGVAHELNNPLQAILGTSELLERDPTVPPNIREEVGLLKAQSIRAREIIRNLSLFSRQQPPACEDIRLGDVATQAVARIRTDFAEAPVEITLEVHSGRSVRANFGDMLQVATNLMINARQAVQAASIAAPRIHIAVFDRDASVRFEVRDNGHGVPFENEAKLFQPFFTTRPVGKGAGLGLSVSYGIIDSHGGVIGYRKNDWGGATFYFELLAVAST